MWIESLINPNGESGLTAKTINRKLGEIRNYWQWMQDHSIVAAIGYWVEGDTLNYITQDGNQNRVSMALVDRDFSKQLNDERHVEFKLPKSN